MSELYHFTASRFIKDIARYGLTRGVMLKSMSPPQFIFNKQWLTKNPDWEQSWAEGTGQLPYKRNETRLTIKIPDQFRSNLKPWSQMKFLVPDVAADLSAFGDPENWFVYDGSIPADWIYKWEMRGSR